MENTKHWVSFWGNAASVTENRPERYAKNITLRYPIDVPFSGEAVRLTFDNYCGAEEIAITKATILYKDKFYPIFYKGEREMKIEAGAQIITDEIALPLQADDTLWVSFYLGDFTNMTAGVVTSGPLSSGRYSIGDQTECKEWDAAISKGTETFYFLNNISMYTEKENRAIICFGDSITSQHWPDYLKLRCKKEGYRNTAVVRRAISGSRVLRQYDCIEYAQYGWSGENRYRHEFPTDGVDTMIILHGINDIIHPVGIEENQFRPMSDLPTAEKLFEGIKMYIELARELGYRVYVGTLLPMKGWRTDTPFRQEIRHQFNELLRNTDLIDGVIDFSEIMENPQNPLCLIPECDSGDHLHPNGVGYEKMAQAIPNEVLK